MTGVEAEWDPDNGRYKLYTRYQKELAGDDIGAYLTFDTEEGEQVEVQMGVSFVSMENARLNLDTEQQGKNFGQVLEEARRRWNDTSRASLWKEVRQSRKPFFIRHSIIR